MSSGRLGYLVESGSGAGVNGRVARIALGAAALVFISLSACSPEAGFPAVHDMPAPRSEAPLTPDQVQKATDSLISERNQLNGHTSSQGNSAGTGAATAKKTPPSTAQPTAQSKSQPNTQQTDPGPMQAGAYAKP